MNKKLYLRVAFSLCAAGVVATACFKSVSPVDGATVRVWFEGNSTPATRAENEVDTDDYILTVTGPDGSNVYSGLFRNSPEVFSVAPGTYTVSAMSRTFTEPAYDAPLYGDTKVVVVSAGEAAGVAMNCEMINCGMRLDADASFRQRFPDATLYMKSSEGSLLYSYGEKRIGYFNPGKISVTMSNGGESETLLNKILEGRQVLGIKLSASNDGSTESAAGVSIQVDTAKEWLCEEYTYGQVAGDPRDAMSVSDARDHVGATGVWVYGYIVGDATSTSKIEFDPPYSKNTNIVIAERSSTTDRKYCMSVELKSGAIRNALNLSDNPTLKGRKVWIKGDISSSYYGLPGVKELTEYSF